MHPADTFLDSVHISVYHAPKNHSSVFPCVVCENMEYVELVTEGGVFYLVEGREEYFGPGTLFWHFPGDLTIHKYRPEAPYACFVAVFAIPGPHRRTASAVTHWNDPRTVTNFCAEILRLYHNDTFDRMILTRHVHDTLLWQAYTSERTARTENMPLVLRKALQLIDRTFASELSLSELAETLGVSAPHLHMLFRKYLNDSPHRRIMERRMQEARNLLASTDLDLKDLSYQCGFQSVEHFCRLFRRDFNMTPTEFRRRNAPPQGGADELILP